MTRDEVLAGTKWEFDQAVTDAFDDMLERSIPAYNTMRDLTTALALRYARAGTDVLDLGCSRGAALARIVRSNKRPAVRKFIGVDVSEPMLRAARLGFNEEIREGLVSIDYCDLRREFPRAEASVILCVLTLQFTPIEYRQTILSRIYASLLPGGIFLLVEKLLGASADLHEVFDDEYQSLKGSHGYTEEQRLRKRASLEGVLVPLTASFNERLLRDAGFRTVDTYWRWLNFAGWIAEK